MTASRTPDFRLIVAFARWVFRAAPRTIQWFAGLFALYVVATVLSLVSLVPVLALSGIVGVDKRPDAAGAILSHWLSGMGSAAVPLVLGGYFFIAATAAAMRYSLALRTSELREKCLLHLRQDTYRTLLNTRWQAQARISDADCLRILTEEAGRIALVIELAAGAMLETMLLCILFAVALWLSGALAIAALAFGLLLFAALAPLRRRASAAGAVLGDEVTAFHRLTAASLVSRKQIRALRRESESHQRLSDAAERVGAAHDRQHRAEAMTSAGLDIGIEAALALLVAGLVLWASIPSATLLLLLYCAVRGFHVLGSVHRGWSRFLANLSAFGRVQALLASLKAEVDVCRRVEASRPFGRESGAASVNLQDVSVYYSGAVEPALLGIDLSIEPGEMIAIVGPSGSGKTSLVDVCAGIIRPDEGTYRLHAGGEPAQIGYVGQEGGLLPLSIRDNLLWSAPTATEDACWKALEQADAGFVRSLPDGLETLIGATRSRFSGGEQKRLALACALVRRPALLVLDEATSQLDAESESRIVAALRKTSSCCTIVLVTHRLVITQVCDRIIEMDQGRIGRVGHFRTLRSTPGFFKRACEQQGLALPADADRSIPHDQVGADSRLNSSLGE